MSQTLITAGQSLLDVALQELGSVAALFDLADAAGLGPTDQLVPGQQLPVPPATSGDPSVAGYFQQKRLRLNTGDLTTWLAPLRPVRPPHDWNFPDFDPQDFDS